MGLMASVGVLLLCAAVGISVGVLVWQLLDRGSEVRELRERVVRLEQRLAEMESLRGSGA